MGDGRGRINLEALEGPRCKIRGPSREGQWGWKAEVDRPPGRLERAQEVVECHREGEGAFQVSALSEWKHNQEQIWGVGRKKEGHFLARALEVSESG